MINITDEDIAEIEQKYGLCFDDESKAFIKCMETKDIIACPGAGKTTSLVAKLDILSKHLPLDDNSGILVLTHTNVAVDEIKKRLGIGSDKLLSYPNHIGTFQSFVNKFLAIPMYVKLTEHKPERIDNEIFEQLCIKYIPQRNLFGLKQKFLKSAKTDEEQINNVKTFLKSFYLNYKDELLYKFDGTNFDYKHNPPSGTYVLLKELKKNIFEAGYLNFNDTYQLAKDYLNDYPDIIKIFQKRFRYVFIDETQDTNDIQFEILNKLFDGSGVVIQKIGDINQAIYNYDGETNSGWKYDETNHLEIKKTKRLSPSIATQVEKMAVVPKKLNASSDIDIKPIIIIFNQDNISKVLETFAKKIIENNLHNNKNNIFKAVGAVGKEHSTHNTIVNYHTDYKKNPISIDIDNIIGKFADYQNDLSIKLYRDVILDILKDYLKNKQLKNSDKQYTYDTIFSILKDNDELYNEFRLLLLQLSTSLYHKECIKYKLPNLIDIFLKMHDGQSTDNDCLTNIIKSYTPNIKKIQQNSNCYSYECTTTNTKIDIKLSTIHKVKGETHTATLVLGTYSDGYDISQLFGLVPVKTMTKLEKKQKLLYVAMSRPTHFLCLAIVATHTHRKKDYTITNEDIALLESNGFEVILI